MSYTDVCHMHASIVHCDTVSVVSLVSLSCHLVDDGLRLCSNGNGRGAIYLLLACRATVTVLTFHCWPKNAKSVALMRS